MRVSRCVAAALIWTAAAAPAWADVTLRFKGSGQVLGTESQEATEYRKGLKQRTDSSHNGMSVSSIIDLGTGRMIILWHHRKTAEVTERKQISELFPTGGPVVPPSITPTTQSRQIAGWTCIVHQVKGSYPMRPMDWFRRRW